jgi:hypothetical protein
MDARPSSGRVDSEAGPAAFAAPGLPRFYATQRGGDYWNKA